MSTIDEQIKKQKELVEQQKNKLKKLEAKAKEKERAERTHRLCELGGVMEKIIGSENNTEEFRQGLLAYALKDRTTSDGKAYTCAENIIKGAKREMLKKIQETQK